MNTNKEWDLGITTFNNAFLLTANVDVSIRVALYEISTRFPDSLFDEASFTSSVITGLKDSELVDKNYEFKPLSNFNDEFLARFDAKLEYEKLMKPVEKEARMKIIKFKMDEIVNSISGLTHDQKKTFTVKIIELLSKNTNLDERQVNDVYSFAIGMPSMAGLNDKQQIEFGKKLMQLKSKHGSLTDEQILKIYSKIVDSTNK